MATSIRQSRGARPTIEILEDGAEPEAFWAALGGKGRVKEASEADDDEEYEAKAKANVKLYRVSDASGELGPTQATLSNPRPRPALFMNLAPLLKNFSPPLTPHRGRPGCVPSPPPINARWQRLLHPRHWL